MSRTRGARNLMPSDEFKRDLLKLLRDKALRGDAAAAGWLLMLSELRDRENRNAA